MSLETLPTELYQEIAPYWPGLDTALVPTHSLGSVVHINPDPQQGWVLKTPHTAANWRQSVIDHEGHLLDTLEMLNFKLPVEIPRLKEYGADQTYIITSYVPGETTTNALDFLTMTSPNERQEIGRTMGTCIAGIARAMPRAIYEREGLSNFPVPFYRLGQISSLCMSGKGQSRKSRVLDSLLEEIADHRTIFTARRGEAFFFGHNDLHTGNFITRTRNGCQYLSGIIDWGAAQASSPEQEMRFVRGLDAGMTETCVAAYEQASGDKVSHEKLRLWGLAEYALRMDFMLDRGVTDARPYKVARFGLCTMRPDLDWGELDSLVP